MTKPKKAEDPSMSETLAAENIEKGHPNSKTDMNSEAAIKEAKYWVEFNKK
jgi:hypothetical protein